VSGVLSGPVSPEWLARLVAALFVESGLSETASKEVAGALVDADVHGVTSHGTMLVPLYLKRIRSGSVSTEVSPEVLIDRGVVALLDGRNALGQLTSPQAMGMAVAKARSFGAGVVAVRRAFHFGRAGRYAEQAAREGLIGLAMSNTRPLMPAPGGAMPAIGNNPMAFAFPREGDDPLVIDVALSQSSMGAVRLAAKAGRSLPEGWAADSEGRPTTDPGVALAGMLLPAGGHKGFALALAVEALTGVLAGGAFGPQVRPLYGDPSEPYSCSHLFMALDPDAFGAREDFSSRIAELCTWLRGPGGAPRLPGDRSREVAEAAAKRGIDLGEGVLEELMRLAAEHGVEVEGYDQRV